MYASANNKQGEKRGRPHLLRYGFADSWSDPGMPVLVINKNGEKGRRGEGKEKEEKEISMIWGRSIFGAINASLSISQRGHPPFLHPNCAP